MGDETIRFRAHHPDAEIIAVEPEPGDYSILEKNFGRDPSVHCIRAGLWPETGELRIIEGDSNQVFRVEQVEDNEPHDVEGVSIPLILERSGWDINLTFSNWILRVPSTSSSRTGRRSVFRVSAH